MPDGDSPEEKRDSTELTGTEPADDVTRADDPGSSGAPVGQTRRLGEVLAAAIRSGFGFFLSFRLAS